MKKIAFTLFVSLFYTGLLAQNSFSSATMEVQVEVISGTTVESVQPLQIVVKDDRLQQQKDGLFAIRALEGVDFEVQLAGIPELKNEYGESIRLRLSAEKKYDSKESRNNVYLRPADSDALAELTRGSYEGTVNTSIYYM
ncbi:hypothetical protein AB2B38_002685 [Balneola sp. MJW-20]|uniref:hypothetical protein n=1 Tax=Gracilimonas aurantiaca TaxID=3234185 RepID=UPI003465F53F